MHKRFKKLVIEAITFEDFCESYDLDPEHASEVISASSSVSFGGEGMTLVMLSVLLDELGIARLNPGDEPDDWVVL